MVNFAIPQTITTAMVTGSNVVIHIVSHSLTLQTGLVDVTGDSSTGQEFANTLLLGGVFEISGYMTTTAPAIEGTLVGAEDALTILYANGKSYGLSVFWESISTQVSKRAGLVAVAARARVNNYAVASDGETGF